MCSQIMPSLVRIPCVVPSNFLYSLHQTRLFVKSHRPKMQERTIAPMSYRPENQATGTPLPCLRVCLHLSVSLTPVLRCLTQRIFMSICQSSTARYQKKKKRRCNPASPKKTTRAPRIVRLITARHSRLFLQVARWSHEGLTTSFKHKTMCVKS